MNRNTLSLAFLCAVAAGAGCASPPIPTDVRTLVASPADFEGERVEVTAPVAENTFASNGHAVWRLRLGRQPETVLAYEEGTNGAVLRNATELADKAGKASESVTVTGIFRTGAHGSHISGARIEMETFRFGDEAIDTDYGDRSPYTYWGYYGWGWGWGPAYYGRWGWYYCD